MQELVLDAVEQMLQVVSPPAIARRLTAPVVEQYDTTTTVGRQVHYVFLQAELDPRRGKLRVLTIGVVTKPA